MKTKKFNGKISMVIDDSSSQSSSQPKSKHTDDGPTDKEHGDSFKLIISFISRNDKFRCKLLNLSTLKRSISFEQAFPKRFATERYHYIASGSYAKVYKHEIASQVAKHHEFLFNWNNLGLPRISNTSKSTQTTIIKLIEVYSEGLLMNLNGVNVSSSVSTYKDAYNDFRVSLSLSYLNEGVRYKNIAYQCPMFPFVYGCYIINTSVYPEYFEDNAQLKRIDYKQLMGDEEKEDNTDHVTANISRPTLKDVMNIKPEIAAIEMEDCGQSLYEEMLKYRPLEILSVTKQLLMGFTVAEDCFEFEHRDLHLGNVLVKTTTNDRLIFVYRDQFLQMPSHRLLVKVIDTTFSRLRIKNRKYYRDLSHLFEEKDLENEAGKKNPLAHQAETYNAMASQVKKDWQGFHPRTNIMWLIYLIKKFIRLLQKLNRNENTVAMVSSSRSRERIQVQSLLKHYVRALFKVPNLKTFFEKTLCKNRYNKLVPIVPILIQKEPTATTTTSNATSVSSKSVSNQSQN